MIVAVITIIIFNCKSSTENFRRKDIFLIHVPKTGGSAIKAMGVKTVDDDQWHLKSRDIDKKKNRKLVAFVRNPYDRLVSVWSYYKQGGGNKKEWYFKELADMFDGFDDFVIRGLDVLKDYHHLRPQVLWTHDERGRCLIDEIGRFETFEKDTKRIFGIDLPSKINTSRHRNWVNYYKGKEWISDKVYEIYRDDFEVFGYSREI